MTTPGSFRLRRDTALKGFIVLAALLLAALTWGFTLVSMRAERREAQAHAEADVANLALAVEWQLDRQLRSIDQAMLVLARQWRVDPAHLDLSGGQGGWQRGLALLPLLREVSPDMFVLDAQGRVTAATRPDTVGTSLAATRVFAALRASVRPGLLVVPTIDWKTTGRWRIELARRLQSPGGGFAGGVVAAYDPWSLTNMLEQVDLGPRGLIALVGDDGAMRALVSPHALPPGQDVAGSAMFRALRRAPQGVWAGRSAPDGVARIHAFRRLAGQDLTILVGVDRDVALRDVADWAATVRWFAWGVPAAILVLAWMLWQVLDAARLRSDQLAAAHAEAERAQARAEGKAAQVEGILSGMSDGVMLLDEQLRLALWNERFALYSGVPAELLRVGVPMEDMLRAQARGGEFGPLASEAAVEAELRRRMDRLRAGRTNGQQERMRPGGRGVEFRRSALPGGGFVTLYTDITARRQTEAAQAEARRMAAEAAEQKAGLVAVVSHEIRTPLSAVLGSLALLDQSSLSDAQQALADTAREAGTALLDLVNDVLEMSGMAAGSLQVRPAPFAVRAMLSGIESMFRAQAEARGIRLAVEIDPALPRVLHADSGRLRQVLMNFVGNAIKFAAPGPVVIRAAWALGEDAADGDEDPGEGQRSVLMGVRDSGPRIPPREAALLFRPFSRLAPAHAGGVPGTGLGLAICAGLVELMGGQVGVGFSAEGGNEFWLTLPFAAVSMDEDATPAREQAASPRERAGASVLLVEDMPANRRITAMLLRGAGHRVEAVDDGLAAVELVRTRPFDVVFMDLAMPGISGYQAARLIRALPGAAGRVPIVALTATSAPEDRLRCAAAGLDAVLAKPASAADLAAVIERLAWADRDAPGESAAVADPAGRAGDEGAIDRGLVDLGRLAELRAELTGETLAYLLERCVSDIRRRLALLDQELGRDDAAAAAAGAHALAGMAATYGLARLELRIRRVMALAEARDVAGARGAADGLDLELADAAEAARAFLTPQPAVA